MATPVQEQEIALAVTDDEDYESWMSLDADNSLPIQIKSVPAVKRGRQMITLEGILKEKQKKLKMQESTPTVTKAKKGGVVSSDEEDFPDDGDANVEKAENIIERGVELFMDGESEAPVKWGEKVFGPEKPYPHFTVSDSDTGLISRILKLNGIEGTGGISKAAATMASSGLLLSWVILERRCDETTARWIFHQMAFSKNECVEKGTCKILCDLLARQTSDGQPICKFEWLPSLEDIMNIFHVYGYLDDSEDKDVHVAEANGKTDSAFLEEDNALEAAAIEQEDEPPSNIRSILQFLVVYLESRKWYDKLSVPEAENLAVALVRCQLDRRMLSVSNLVQLCFQTLIYYFTEEEWTSSCERIASAMSRISSMFVNNLRVAKSLHATNSRLGSLQRFVVLQLLSRHVERDLSSAEDVVSIFKSINLKDQTCNFLSLLYLLMLADIYLWSDSLVTKSPKAIAVWLEFLKKCCSTQISCSDRRPDAMKVRNWAAFLSQKYQIERCNRAVSTV